MYMKKYFQTEVGLLAIWDSKSLSNIETLEQYQENFVENSSMVKLMNEGKIIVWGTGGDGDFSIELRINPENDLTSEEENIIEMNVKNLKLYVNSGEICIGSPEAVGSAEDKAINDNFINKIENIEIGKYLINIYFLYDSEAMEKENQNDRTGYIVTLKKVSDDYKFPVISEFPQLG